MTRLLLVLGGDWVRPAQATRDVYVSAAERVAPAIALAHHEWSRRVSFLEAATVCGLNAQHFSELFAHTIGMGFAEFGLRIRLRPTDPEARRLVLAIAQDMRKEISAKPLGFAAALRLGVLRILLALYRAGSPAATAQAEQSSAIWPA